jgi:UDP-galactose transporter
MLLSLMVLQNSATVLVGRYSQSRPGGATFATRDLVAMTEFTKMVTCFLLIAVEALPPQHRTSMSLATLPDVLPLLPAALFGELKSMVANPAEALRVAPPAFLYLVQNNILFVALANLSAPVFQVCYQVSAKAKQPKPKQRTPFTDSLTRAQSKLVTTALVSKMLLNRDYHTLQWGSLASLGVGVAVVVLGESAPAASDDSDTSSQSIVLGLLAVAVASLSSAIAGVYFEKVLKGSSTSLWMRNVQLAVISVALSALQRMLTASPPASADDDAEPRAFLEGFDAVTWTLVCLQAFGGLLVAAIVKYADNVVKGLATGVAVVFATTVSVLFLGTALTLNFVVGAAIILASVWVFSNHKKVLVRLEEAKR